MKLENVDTYWGTLALYRFGLPRMNTVLEGSSEFCLGDMVDRARNRTRGILLSDFEAQQMRVDEGWAR